MIYPMHAIKDTKTGFLQPTCDINQETAVRNFAQAVNRKDTIMGFSPSDFELYKVGEYDTESGIITPCPADFICGGMSFLEGVK